MGRKSKKRRNPKRVRAASAPVLEQPERRARFVEITAINGEPVTEPIFGIAVEPIRLDNGSVLMFQSPHVPPFYLLTAKTFRDRAEPKRLQAITKTKQETDGNLRPLDPVGSTSGFHVVPGTTGTTSPHGRRNRAWLQEKAVLRLAPVDGTTWAKEEP